MSGLQVFNNAEFGSVRSLMVNGEPYFVGRDVAKILGYANPNDALAKRVDEEDKGVAKCDTLGGIQELTVINESGLYSLILSSKLPSAKRFKRWVTSEVLPAIRKHGVFVMDDIVNNTDALIEALQAFKAERLQRMALEEELLRCGSEQPGSGFYHGDREGLRLERSEDERVPACPRYSVQAGRQDLDPLSEVCGDGADKHKDAYLPG